MKLAMLLFFSLKSILAEVEVYFDRIELLNATYVPGLYNVSVFRVGKFNRTTYVFNADVETFIPVDDDFDVEVIFYYNRFNNNQYSRTPIRVPRTNLCKTVESFYTMMTTAEIRTSTNIPPVKRGVKWCPVEAVNLHISPLNGIFDKQRLAR